MLSEEDAGCAGIMALRGSQRILRASAMRSIDIPREKAGARRPLARRGRSAHQNATRPLRGRDAL